MDRLDDFSARFVAKWKDGQMPKGKPGNTVVNYDQNNHAYDIAPEDMPDFLEWVANTWDNGTDPRGFWDEGAEVVHPEVARDYLDRRGITVREF